MKRLAASILALFLLILALPSFAARPITPPEGPAPHVDPVPTHAPVPGNGNQHPHIAVWEPFNPDADYDGIPDYADAEVKNNVYSSTVYHVRPSMSIDVSYPYTYTWDYSRLFNDPSTFDSELCRLSALIAGLGYHQSGEDPAGATDENFRVTNSLGSSMLLPELMRAHGMTVEEYNLRTYYNDNHITLADFGVHSVIIDGGTYNVVLIALRGSNATWEEWSSNFEIGHTLASCDPDFVPMRFGSHPDWTEETNHMGFDIAANRVLQLADGFAAQNAPAANGTVYWLTGHSRGAAISNLVAAKLIDRGERVVSYNFACPCNTTNSAAPGYTGIFNIVNEDDMVTYLPFDEWGFTRFGKTARLYMSEYMQDEWKAMMGEKYDHAETTLTNALEKLCAIASGRNDAYRYTCACHGDGSDTSIRTDNWYFTASNRDKAIAKTPACLAGYYKLELEDATFYWTYHCQPPVFFMQYLACYLYGGITKLEFADYDVADKYESAKWALAAAAVMGVGHPHYCESYFIIADHVTGGIFV